MQKIKVRLYNEGSITPLYQSALASGMDLHCSSESGITIAPMSMRLVPTGIFIRIDEPGYEAQVRSRSGLAAKNNIFVLNSPGTIDADYLGEIKVILYNAGGLQFRVNPGDRIAQLVFCPVVQADLQVVTTIEDLGKTARGSGGFGSTGVNTDVSVVGSSS